MQANNVKAMSARAEAIKALAKVKPMIQRVSVNLPTSPISSSGSKLLLTLPRVSGSANQRPRPRLKSKPRLWFQRLQPKLHLLLRLPKVPRCPLRLLSRGLCLLLWKQKGWCDPWAAVCMGLVSSYAICANKPEARSVKKIFFFKWKEEKERRGRGR